MLVTSHQKNQNGVPKVAERQEIKNFSSMLHINKVAVVRNLLKVKLRWQESPTSKNRAL